MTTATFLTHEQRATLLDELVEQTNRRIEFARKASRAFTKWMNDPGNAELTAEMNRADAAYDVEVGAWYAIYDRLDQALSHAPDAD